jgi:DNA polymerase-3 subunit alpha
MSSIKVERTLIFDVETTNLPQVTNDITKQPYITQLSFEVINVYREAGKPVRYESVREEFNHYISIPEDVIIAEKIVKLTGITNEICKNQGIPIESALFEFYNEYVSSNIIVSHNIAFDSKMIFIEMERNNDKLVEMGCLTPYAIFNPLFNRVNNIQIYCTMKNGKNIANILVPVKSKVAAPAAVPVHAASIEDLPGLPPPPPLPVVTKYTKKVPKLIELYTFLYPERSLPIGLHNSMVDTRVCKDCYIKMTDWVK